MIAVKEKKDIKVGCEEKQGHTHTISQRDKLDIFEVRK